MPRQDFYEKEFYDEVIETVKKYANLYGYHVSDECVERIAEELTVNWEGVIANGWA
jgi:hypothetical protein